MIIQPHYDVMHSLSEMHKMLQKMTADEQARFQMSELSSSCHMAEIHIQKVLKKFVFFDPLFCFRTYFVVVGNHRSIVIHLIVNRF